MLLYRAGGEPNWNGKVAYHIIVKTKVQTYYLHDGDCVILLIFVKRVIYFSFYLFRFFPCVCYCSFNVGRRTKSHRPPLVSQ